VREGAQQAGLRGRDADRHQMAFLDPLQPAGQPQQLFGE